MQCIIGSDWKDVKLYVLDPFHLQRIDKLSKLDQSIYSQDHPRRSYKKHLLIWNSIITQNLSIYRQYHNPKGINLVRRLRLGLSHIREHKFNGSF